MLEDLPRHAGYVIAAYGLVGLSIAGLVGWLVHARRAQNRMLERLEQNADRQTDI